MSKAKVIVNNALGDLMKIIWKKRKPKMLETIQYRPDFEGEIRIGKKRRRILIEVKTSGTPMIIAQLAAYSQVIKKNDPNTYLILVAPFVSLRGKELCKELGIGFVDLEGNVYFRVGGVLIERCGKKGEKREKQILKKVFTTKSTWIIRKMLKEPNRSWKTQDLADTANVSIGMVYKTTERLEAEGYLEKSWGSIGLKKPRELLDEWRKAYNYDSQDATGYYSSIDTREDLFKGLRKLPDSSYALTLGAGAYLVAPFVRSSDTHLYINTDFELLKDALDLTPVEFGGNIYIIKPSDDGVLFDTQMKKKVTIVSNIQLYLDLYNYPQRGREQADFLREEKMEI